MQAFWIWLEPITAKFLYATFNQSFRNNKEGMRTFEDPYCFAQLAAFCGSGTTMATNLWLWPLDPWIWQPLCRHASHTESSKSLHIRSFVPRTCFAPQHKRLQHDLTWKWMEIKRKLNGTSFYWMEIDWKLNENKASNWKNRNAWKWIIWVAIKKILPSCRGSSSSYGPKDPDLGAERLINSSQNNPSVSPINHLFWAV